MEKLDQKRIDPPVVRITDEALEQIRLILENDFTVEGKSLRVLISGKGCHGFDYQVGFDLKKNDDFVITLEGLNIDLVMDSFSACYLQNFSIDYVRDFTQSEEGLVVVNHGQAAYRGKFWKSDPSLLPPVQEEGVST